MGPDTFDWLTEIDIEYARFNAKKSVATDLASQFQEYPVGPLVVTTDPSREASYYHRICGLSQQSLTWLDEALDSFDTSCSPIRIDIQADDNSILGDSLLERGFVQKESIAWLEAKAVNSSPAPITVLHLMPDHVDRIRPLLELEGPIENKTWQLRKLHHCSDQFRAFVIEKDTMLVSMGTTFITRDVALLGNAVTLPEYRNRGYQQALISARLVDAQESGIKRIVTDVEPQSSSMRNCLRAGFSPLLEQSVWERDRPGKVF